MQQTFSLWKTPAKHLARYQPDHPILYVSPEVLCQSARRFQDGFDGLVTYAVKANDRAEVLDNLVAAGVHTFDVASPAEMAAVRLALPGAVLHYNNPVRSQAEVEAALEYGIASWSIDDTGELEKLKSAPEGTEIAVRFAMPIPGATYDFGSKFGATPEAAVNLLRSVVAMGFVPALSFHPGTQCADPSAWAQYVAKAAQIALLADVRIARLNVGGGFASHRSGAAPDLEAIFTAIHLATDAAFGAEKPALVCEPGRAMVAEAFTLAARVKALRGDNTVFLNDGVYGGLTDLRDMGLVDRVQVVSPDGVRRTASPCACVVFGPTCDSLDRLPDGLCLPSDMQVGDYVLFAGMGAYSVAMSTRFNGYGLSDVVTVAELGTDKA